VNRVAVIGSGGAGKSVFARELAAKTGLPLIHLDRHYWHPGWVPTTEPEWQAIHAELIAGDRWVIDGNYGGTMEARLARADTVFFLDPPRLVCVWAALRRHWHHRAGGRDDMVAGQKERIDLAFLWWIWRYPDTRRPAVLDRLAKLPPTTHVVRIRRRRQAQDVLAGLSA